jgi:hypothetical protein
VARNIRHVEHGIMAITVDCGSADTSSILVVQTIKMTILKGVCMTKIDNVKVIKEFTNDDITYGIYEVEINQKREFLIRNGDSVGAIQFFYGKPAPQCVAEIREDVKSDFLKVLTEDN